MFDEAETRPRRRLRKRWIAFALLVLIGLASAALWNQRRQIATGFIDRELERRGVAARYEIRDLGFGRQRLEHLVIGDPASPDLVAEWVELRMSYGLRRPRISSATARGVQLRGRIVDGRLSFGQVDKLLPAPTGQPFSLPDIDLDLADALFRLETPAGPVVLSLAGRGNLPNGFRGAAVIRAPQLASGGCSLRTVRASLSLATSRRRPNLKGPVHADSLACGGDVELAQPQVALDVRLASGLDRWSGSANVAAARLQLGGSKLARLEGKIMLDGDSRLTRGRYALQSAAAVVDGAASRTLRAEGGYQASMTARRVVIEGAAAASGVSIEEGAVRPLLATLRSFGGTPIEPFSRALSLAVSRGASYFDVRGRFEVEAGPRDTRVQIGSARAVSRSGARLAISGGDGLQFGPGGIRLDSRFSLAGGGFPEIQARFGQRRPGDPIDGSAIVRPYIVDGARLTLAPIRFQGDAHGTTRILTAAEVDGPFSGGAVRRLQLPIEGRFGRQGFSIGERCTPVAFQALRYGTLSLAPARISLCPTGRALVWSGADGIRGGGTASNVRLAGDLGSSPMVLTADRFRFDVAQPGFAAGKVAVRLGRAGYVNRLDLVSLTGSFNSDGVRGALAGANGKIANVPLVLSQGSGRWSVIGGRARIDGRLTVTDEAAPARFEALRSDDFRLTLANGRIDATGWLKHPETGMRVLRTDIDHDLASGRGRAVLDVSGIAFDEKFQPEQLTRLTIGVVALVKGELAGRGEIAWTPQATTSRGTFSTTNMDLAAPFGPVTGLTTTIDFTDLLGLVTAPGQQASVQRIQTGIDVFDGQVRYQLMPGLNVRVETASWPFAGGRLELDDTILDFSQESAKKLTFRVIGMDAASFVEQMQFSNIAATGTFDGVVPMVFDQQGGRIVGGHLSARQGGGTVSYIGELTEAQLGAYGKLAFDALKSMRYSKLTVTLDGALDGEFVAGVELDGIAREAPNPGGIPGLALQQLAKIPFEFNIVARGPFRAILGTMRSLKDPSGLIQQVLPQDIRDRPTTINVQTKESEPVQ